MSTIQKLTHHRTMPAYTARLSDTIWILLNTFLRITFWYKSALPRPKRELNHPYRTCLIAYTASSSYSTQTMQHTQHKHDTYPCATNSPISSSCPQGSRVLKAMHHAICHSLLVQSCAGARVVMSMHTLCADSYPQPALTTTPAMRHCLRSCPSACCRTSWKSLTT